MNNNNNKRSVKQPSSARKAPKQISKEDAIALERRRIEELRRRKQMMMLYRKAFPIVLFSVIGLVLALGTVFLYIHFDFNKKASIPKDGVKTIMESTDPIFLSEDNYFYRNGEYYISLKALSDNSSKHKEFPTLFLHGSSNKMTLGIDGSSDSVSFCNSSNTVNVNGTNSEMANPAYFENGMMFVPQSFFTDFCHGVKCEFNNKGKKDAFCLDFENDFGFNSKALTELPVIPYSKILTAKGFIEVDEPEFKCDLSAYEMYMNPADPDEYLTLINSAHPLDKDYAPSDLINITNTRKDGRATQKMRLYAAKSLEALFVEMRAAGFTDVSVTSGYRSYESQSKNFENEVAIFGGDREKAAQSVALPGTSEHQSGLCIDMHNLSSASQAFEKQDAYDWLRANCANFGFILRFPKDKSDITGIIFEPWHYRYVGRFHAQQIMEQGVCLEEYIDMLES